MAKMSDILKNLFFLLLLLQFAPLLIKSIKKQYSDLLETKTKIGLINIDETIMDSDKYIKNLHKFFKDESIKAIVLKIDSPGGAAGACQNIFNEIKALRAQYNNKYVVAFIQNMAASGGYYIAAAANYIISTPASFIGSIGSYIAHPNFKQFIENYKIKYEVISTGDYKTAGNPLLDLTEPQKSMLQSLSDNVYKQFINDIAEQRPHLPADPKEWANGKIFTGKQALALKLIDELGSNSTVVKILREKAHVEGKIEWVKAKKYHGILASLLEEEDDSDSEFTFGSFINNICKVLEQRYFGTRL